jgi:hypothetical protein
MLLNSASKNPSIPPMSGFWGNRFGHAKRAARFILTVLYLKFVFRTQLLNTLEPLVTKESKV